MNECEVCAKTETLVGVNGRWFCMDHLDEAFAPIGEQVRAIREAAEGTP